MSYILTRVVYISSKVFAIILYNDKHLTTSVNDKRKN